MAKEEDKIQLEGTIVEALPGTQFRVRLDNGQYTAIVQEATGEAFAPGEKVRILSGNGTSRVTH